MKRLLGVIPLLLGLLLSPIGAATARGEGRLVYAVGGNIFSIRPDGSGARRLTSGSENDWGPMWSHDRRHIAFLRTEGDLEQTDLWVMESDGGEVRKIAGPTSAFFDWSPDDKSIVYEAALSRAEPWELDRSGLALVDLETSEERQLTGSGQRPVWSPNGRIVAFEDQTCPEGGMLGDEECNSDIYSVWVSDGRVRRLTTAEGDDRAPSWSPNGHRIAFSTDRHDTLGTEDGGAYTSEIYVMDADGSDETRVTRDKRAHDQGAVWSPNGRWIAFLHRYDDDVAARDGEILLMRPDGSGRRKLTADRRFQQEPSWSPDGSRITFLATKRTRAGGSSADSEIFIVRISDLRVWHLTRNERHEDGLFWWNT